MFLPPCLQRLQLARQSLNPFIACEIQKMSKSRWAKQQVSQTSYVHDMEYPLGSPTSSSGHFVPSSLVASVLINNLCMILKKYPLYKIVLKFGPDLIYMFILQTQHYMINLPWNDKDNMSNFDLYTKFYISSLNFEIFTHTYQYIISAFVIVTSSFDYWLLKTWDI